MKWEIQGVSVLFEPLEDGRLQMYVNNRDGTTGKAITQRRHEMPSTEVEAKALFNADIWEKKDKSVL